MSFNLSPCSQSVWVRRPGVRGGCRRLSLLGLVLLLPLERFLEKRFLALLPVVLDDSVQHLGGELVVLLLRDVTLLQCALL